MATLKYWTGSEWSVACDSGTAIPDSGISRYEFEQDLTDSWNGNDGTGSGGITYTTSNQVGTYAAVLDGTDDEVALPFQLDSDDDWSFVGWVYFESHNGFDPLITQRQSFSGQDFSFYYKSDNSEWGFSAGESGSTEVSGLSQPTGSWVHLAFTKGGDSYTLYRDASDDWSFTNSTSWTTSETLKFGVWDGGSAYANIRADHFDFHSKELTQTEVQNHRDTGSING